MAKKLLVFVCLLAGFSALAQDLNPLEMRWTFGAHEPLTMYRRVGKKCTGGIDGNARWVKDWLDWFDSDSPALMQELGLNWLHCRFYKGMGWEVEKEDFPNVKRFVDNCHAHGVHALAYVQLNTLYPEIMRHEIPDIESWQAVDAGGHPIVWQSHTYYRTTPCIHCAEWEEYLKEICTIALRDGGFDGIMFDNAYSSPCCCPRCEKSFQEYLASLPDKKERFGFEDLSGFSIPKRFTSYNSSGEIREPLMQAWIDWRTRSLTELFLRLRAHIKSVNPNAIVSANALTFRNADLGTEQGINLVEMMEALDLLIGQNEHYPGCQDGRITSRIRELKMARDLRKPIVALCDSDAKMTPEQERHYLLPLYEDLMFGGVPTDRTVLSPKPIPGFVDREKLDRRRPQLSSFNRFVKENETLFTSPVYAPVRLLYPEHEMLFSQSAQESLCAAEEILSRRQIPWGYLISTPWRPFDVPEGTEVIVVPGLLSLSPAQVEGLARWARNGGKLIVTGDSGRYDPFNAQYLVNPLLTALKGAPNTVLRTEADRVSPAILGWTNNVGVPADGGKRLLEDLEQTGFRLPFTLKNCPQEVALDVRKTTEGYVLHFLNYLPSKPVKGLKVNGKTVAPFSEYTFVKISSNQ